MSTRVSLIAAETYEPATVRRAVDEAIAEAGGLDGIVSRGDRVFVKINHLGNHPSDSGIITHPEIAAAVAGHLKDLGARVTLGDGLETEGHAFFGDSGYLETAKRYGLELVNLKGAEYVDTPTPSGGHLAIASAALEADCIINVPKLKTHALTLMTCAVKNFYGLLPQYLRRNLHRDHIVPKNFAAAVVDIYQAVKPAFHVVDAITTLEGFGPSRGGKPKHLGLVMAGADGVAVDAVAATIIGMNPLDIATTRIAAERGLGVADLARIDLRGIPLTRAAAKDFALPESMSHLTNFIDRLPGPVARCIAQFAGLMREIPRIVPRRCIACGLCRKHCPQGAIRIDKVAHIDYTRCISCFCCQEFCQSDAIELSHTAAGKLILNAYNTVRSIAKRGRRREKSNPVKPH